MQKRASIALTIFAAALALAGARTIAQSQPDATYAWHAELVSLDEGTRTLTVKARAVDAALADVKKFKAGERVLLKWSGFDTSADAIRGVAKYGASQASTDRFLFPADLATPELQNDYVTFKVQVPADAIAELKTLKPGEWITFTARHRPASDADAVVAVRPYVQTDSAT